jgi:hypothetical protein
MFAGDTLPPVTPADTPISFFLFLRVSSPSPFSSDIAL